ncbi:MAG: M28 family peptidase [Phycisphaerales bacterium]|nr:MAG: M28 family peptidase [Phycisphaerales bacterium]
MSDKQTAKDWRLLMASAAMTLGLAAAAPATDEGMAAADEVDQAIYYDLMDNWLYTHAGDDRGYGPEHDLARDNIAFLMESYGLNVTLEPFTYSSTTYYNVVGEMVGTLYPDQIYLIGSHYDSVSNPGADDNASGTALFLECARIISQYDSEYTIRFIGFDREEQGLIGSYAYVSAHSTEDIRGMISADMVAFDTGTNHVSIYGRTASNPIKLLLGAAIEEYGGMTWSDYGQLDASDHAPFEAAGFQACLLIEGEFWSNPYYHTQQDNIDNPDNINWDYAYKMTRSAVGWLVDQAHVQVNFDGLKFTYPDGLPQFVAPAGGTKLRVEVTGMGNVDPEPGTGVLYYDVGSGWQSSAMEVVADNVYDAVFPPATCGDEVHYYVSAEEGGGQVYTHPKNAPASYHTSLAAYGYAVALEYTFDADPGWTTENEWAFGQPTGQGGGSWGYPDPTSGFTGDYVYGVNLTGDYSTDVGGPYYLTTGAIDCTELGGTSLQFRRWLNSDYQPYVLQTIEVSNDGANWTLLWDNGSSEIAENAWSEQAYDMSDVADGEPAVYIRWGHEVGQSGAWAYSGWNIDDVQIVALDCNDPCPADVNGTDVVDIDDLFQVLGAWGTCDDCPEDVNDDGVVDIDDIFAVLGNWGPCP